MRHPPFVISRLLKAPRQLVWDVHSQAHHLSQWLGPKGCTMPHCDLDFRPGGTLHYCMEMPGGKKQLWGMWQIREVQAPQKIVLVQHFSDRQRGVCSNPWDANWPLLTLATTTLTEEAEGTLFSLTWQAHEASEVAENTFFEGHASMHQGWSGNLDVLENYLLQVQAA
jgi:uncharacterized protein YndB with AHSA1/START domain